MAGRGYIGMKEAETTKKAICAWCFGHCGVLVRLKNGRLKGVEEDPQWPKKIWPPIKACVRRKAAAEWFYHKDRVNFPLKRSGERGEGKWQTISWDQALDEIAQRMDQLRKTYGPETIANARGTRRTDIPVMMRFFNMLGTPNSCLQANICFLPRAKVADYIAGYFPHYSVRPTTNCIVELGVEGLVARPVTAKAILDAKKRGAKLIVIDPRRTRSASMADIWLQLRPGTDTALLLGMAKVIIDEDLYDKEFVEKWCHGFNELREHVAQYTPEKVNEITDVPADVMRAAARMYAANRPGAFIEGMGVEQAQDSIGALHARWILAGLTGNINVEGGDEQWGPHPTMRHPRAVVPAVLPPPGQYKKQIGTDRFRLFSLEGLSIQAECGMKVWGSPPLLKSPAHAPSVYRAMITGKPYPVRAMICAAANPMVTQANTKLVHEALKALDLLVVNDFWLTPTAELADYVLPVASWLERPHLCDFGGYADSTIAGEAALPKVIPGEYEHKDDYDIWRELATRLGQGEYFPWETLEAYYDHVLEPTGYTHSAFVHELRCEPKPPQHKRYEKFGFATPTGKVEFRSTVLERLDYDPFPGFREPAETDRSDPELAKKYPLRLLTGGRVREYFHSEWRQIKSVRKLHPDPLVQIHPDTAESSGIRNDDWVWIETLRGRVKQKAQLFDGIPDNVVHAEHGWWFPELPGDEPSLHGVWESNINVVLNDDPDVCNDKNGGWPLKTALCKIYKVE
jgi:thiosulfate reductase/polysulfide reductase chain A